MRSNQRLPDDQFGEMVIAETEHATRQFWRDLYEAIFGSEGPSEDALICGLCGGTIDAEGFCSNPNCKGHDVRDADLED